MDAVNFTSAARIRVLLVPVGPIKKATFERHVKMLRQHNSVKLEEVWMGPRTENCKDSIVQLDDWVALCYRPSE